MDISSHILAILGVAALIVFYNLRKYGRKNKGKLPPEAKGALPIIGHLHLLNGPKIVPRVFGDLADKHGSVFSIRLGSSRAVVISTQEVMKECFTVNDKVLGSRPNSSQSKYLAYDNASFGFAPYGSYWRNVRKLAMMELLSSQRMRTMKEFYEAEVDDMVQNVYSQWKLEKGPVKINMSERFEHLIINMMTNMIAGKRFFGDKKGKEEKEVRPVGDIVREFLHVAGVMVPADYIPLLGWMNYFPGPVQTMKRLLKEVDELMGNWIEEHELKAPNSDSDAKQDFIDIMLSAIPDDTTFGRPRHTIIKATIVTFIIAGADTTSVGMTWVLSNLMNNKRCLDLVLKEIDEKIGRDRMVQDADVEKLEYLHAVIKETLRLYTPGPLGLPRMADDDLYMGGYLIPKGTQVFANYWKLHRDPKVWSNPDEFIPERFLTGSANAKTDANGLCYEFLPFGSGRRTCPGLSFAMRMMHLSVARLVQAFNLTTPMNLPVDMTEGLALSLPKATPLEAVITPRLATELFQH